MPVRVQKQVLVVDNEDNLRLAFERRLQEAGCRALSTWSGVEAIELLESHRFDVLLVDDYLPDLHVGAFLKHVSLLPFPPQVLVMQSNPTQTNVRFHGSKAPWPLVDKTQIARIIQAIGPSASGPVT